jgi:hypothetical protein
MRGTILSISSYLKKKTQSLSESEDIGVRVMASLDRLVGTVGTLTFSEEVAPAAWGTKHMGYAAWRRSKKCPVFSTIPGIAAMQQCLRWSTHGIMEIAR